MDTINTVDTEWESDLPEDKPCWRHESGKTLALVNPDNPTNEDEPWEVHGDNTMTSFETEEEAREYIQKVINSGRPSGML